MTSKKFSNIPVTNGTATTTFTPTTEEIGTYNLTAKYIQNDTYKETISVPVNLTINPQISYTLAIDNNPSEYGEAVYFTVTDENDNPVTTGNLTLMIDGQSIILRASSGRWYVTHNFTAGEHDYELIYTDVNSNTTSVTGTLIRNGLELSINTATQIKVNSTDPITIGGDIITPSGYDIQYKKYLVYLLDKDTGDILYSSTLTKVNSRRYRFGLGYTPTETRLQELIINFEEPMCNPINHEITVINTTYGDVIDCNSSTSWYVPDEGSLQTNPASVDTEGYISAGSESSIPLEVQCNDLQITQNMAVMAKFVVTEDEYQLGFKSNMFAPAGNDNSLVITESQIVEGHVDTNNEYTEYELNSIPFEKGTVIECMWDIYDGSISYVDTQGNMYETEETYSSEDLENMIFFFGYYGISIHSLEYEFN